MPQAQWRIRFYLPFDETNTINFVGSFENNGKRYLDDLVIFRGMYETPDYLMWYVHKDLVNYNFSNYSMEVKLYLGQDSKTAYFQDKFRIIDVGDDLKSNRKIVYAIQEDYAKLETLLINANISKLEYKETRTPEQVLRDILEVNGIFPVKFNEHDEPDLMSIQFEYQKFTLDPKWTVGDFIKYVADENNFEWTIKEGILFIGPELPTYKKLDATKEFIDRQVDNISKNYFNMKIAFNGSPMDVLYYYELKQDERLTDMRCVWTKHWVGSNGDVTKGCFIPVGTKMEKVIYLESLEGMKEQLHAYSNFYRTVKFNPAIELCRVVTDEGENEYADNVSIEKDIDNYAKKTPRNVIMNVDSPIYSVDKVGRTTPYLDHEAGLLFPRSNDLTNNPNQLLFYTYDRVEQSVLGPFVMGNGSEDFTIPYKEADDFRLQFPNGWCLYVSSDGKTILQPSDTEPSEEPSEDDSAMQILLDPATGLMKINKDNNSYIEINEDGKVKINCNSSQQVSINAGTTSVSLQGHTHQMSNHIHPVSPGPLIPGPQVTTSPPTTNDTVGETDKHSKHLKCVEE